jgi:hypothetical protein
MSRLYFFICIILLAACQREDSDIIEPIEVIVEETETFFDSHFIGKTTDENGVTLAGVQVSISDDTDYTTDNGVFLFNNTKTNSTGALIKMSKSGYYDQYTFIPKSANQFSNVNIELQKKNNHQVFSGKEQNELAINTQISLTIPAGALINTDGTAYEGQVKLYTNFIPVLGNMPYIDKHFRKGILVNNTTFHFIFETLDGLPLQLNKSLTLKVNTKDVKVGRLDTQKAKWIETTGEVKDAFFIAKIDQTLPYIIGQFKPVSKINTQIVNETQTGVSFTNMAVKSEQQETIIVHPDQDGHVSFYAASNTQFSIAVSDVCGQVLAEKSISVGKDGVQQAPNIVLQNQDLWTVKSTIEACGLPLSDQDLVNVYIQSKEQYVVAYQSQNEQTYVVPNCLEVDKASYFRGKEKKFSVTFSGTANDQFLDINAMPLCIEKVSGYFSVNDVPVLLDMSQYYIFRETSDPKNVVISDLNGFMISIPKVVGKGQYQTDAIIFNHPTISDCQLAECSEMKVWIDEISQPGAIVKIRLEGMMNGNKVKGEFANLLKY